MDAIQCDLALVLVLATKLWYVATYEHIVMHITCAVAKHYVCVKQEIAYLQSELCTQTKTVAIAGMYLIHCIFSAAHNVRMLYGNHVLQE